ncbi:uncharacterized protein LOC118481053 [Helianthus annuus]|uniref:uncharacterized protein LOC118481053 n=1 Tax=Helianthus annuus TaxID=4232 RepID=UPI00165332C2|nr:uncharacterized protein LOC118481053 [Helianthus annuus]
MGLQRESEQMLERGRKSVGFGRWVLGARSASLKQIHNQDLASHQIQQRPRSRSRPILVVLSKAAKGLKTSTSNLNEIQSPVNPVVNASPTKSKLLGFTFGSLTRNLASCYALMVIQKLKVLLNCECISNPFIF